MPTARWQPLKDPIFELRPKRHVKVRTCSSVYLLGNYSPVPSLDSPCELGLLGAWEGELPGIEDLVRKANLSRLKGVVIT